MSDTQSMPEVPEVPGDATIDTNDSDALNSWSERLGISRDELLAVIDITGKRASDVADYVRNEGSPGNSST